MLVNYCLPVGADAIDGPVDFIHVANSTSSSCQPRLNLVRVELAQVVKVVVHLIKFTVPVIDDILGRFVDDCVKPLIDTVLFVNEARVEFIVDVLCSHSHLSLSLLLSFGKSGVDRTLHPIFKLSILLPLTLLEFVVNGNSNRLVFRHLRVIDLLLKQSLELVQSVLTLVVNDFLHLLQLSIRCLSFTLDALIICFDLCSYSFNLGFGHLINVATCIRHASQASLDLLVQVALQLFVCLGYLDIKCLIVVPELVVDLVQQLLDICVEFDFEGAFDLLF